MKSIVGEATKNWANNENIAQAIWSFQNIDKGLIAEKWVTDKQK